MSRERVGRVEQLLWNRYDWFRSPQAHDVPIGDADDFESMVGRKHALLVTFRRNGDPVPSPMWFGLRDGRLYCRTGAESWKVKRIASNPQVVIAPATMRGRPLGLGVRATARILPPEEHRRAIEARIENYGAGRWAYDATVARVYGEAAYLEIVAAPARPPRSDHR